MQQMIKKLKQLLLYGGLEKEQYLRISDDINESNRKSIVILSIACLLFYGVRLCMRYSAVPRSNQIVFTCAIILFGLLAVTNTIVRQNHILIHISAYLFMAFYLGVGIVSAIGPGSIAERTTLYLVFVVVAPMLYALSAAELFSMILPAELLYLALIHHFQRAYPVYATNVGNSVFLSLSGLLLGVYMANMKISGIYNTYMNARAEEIRALNEQLAASQKKLEAALADAEQANHAKTTFLNSMSHDIRTPMNAIIGFTNLASAHADDAALVKDYLGKIGIASHHLLALINDVLDMSRIESGTVKLVEKPLDLPALAEGIRTIVQSGMEEKQLAFEVRLEPLRSPAVMGDGLRIQQVLLNILGNAMKFTPAGGRVFFQLRQLEDSAFDTARYEFRIRDTGIGMSEEFQKHIFEAFSRENTSTVQNIQGTGLGMSITKRFVDLMDGTIAVRSKEGAGSEFIVTLPLAACDPAELEVQKDSVGSVSQKALSEQRTMAFTGKKILLAEDNALNAEIATAILEGCGFFITVVSDGSEAVEAMRHASASDYDLILMDIQMPNLNGYDATKQIRALPDPAVSRIPIIAMTANAFEEDRQAALAAGMNGHLAKPIDVEKLTALLLQILG